MKIRAAVLESFGAPLEVQELELAEPRAGEVLVRLVACGVCHTDLFTASGADPSGYSPAVLGHEGAGVVERVGEGVQLGGSPATTSSPSSRRSAASASTASTRGRTSASRSASSRGRATCPTARRGSRATASPCGTSWAPRPSRSATVMPEIALAKVSPEAPLDRACLFACGLSTGLGAAMNTAKVAAGSTCVVFGAGMVGLGAVAGCRLQGAERIVCVDLSEERLELARGQGATETLVGGPDAVDADRRADRRLRRRLHVRGDRERRGDAAGGRVRADGLGPRHDVRRRRQGRDPRRRAALPDHRAARGRIVVRRREGPRPGAAARRALARRRDRRRAVRLAQADARTRSTAASS